MEKEYPLKLSVITPKGAATPIFCDSVQLNVSNNAEEKHGGSYGIRKGHIQALFSLEKGPLNAYLNGERILAAQTGDGFATVENDTVIVVVDEYAIQ